MIAAGVTPTDTVKSSASTSVAKTRTSGPPSSEACDRGLHGVELVISNATAALSTRHQHRLRRRSLAEIAGPLMRNALAKVGKGQPRSSPPRSAPSSATHLSRRPRAIRSRREDSRSTAPGHRRPAPRRRTRDHRLRRLPRSPLAQSLVDEPARTVEQGQAAHRRGRHLPRRQRPTAPGRLRPHRDPGRRASLRPPLPLLRHTWPN